MDKKLNLEVGVAEMARRPFEIARTVNAPMNFSSDDQHEVFEDYFCEPGSEDEEDDSYKDALDHDIGQATPESK